ncbi:coiled-coil domain-containing protein 74B-like isoform X1 [Phyllopteryx taeniolatus]|uniref:coiled-coil domain-containing protein 74B-like isoform X1 n=1 Tax=Phyllopteryx taeniolatus TaxID=161469 RepID=UPI002AD4D2B6|nr:coiled-coil domain-containing protein 74B-like isoform X1 [Phyllopteryx taeniolatus]
MSGSNLPPVRHLPQWSRVGRLGVPCSPRRLPANRLQPLPVLPAGDREVPRATTGSGHVDADTRVASLQRNIEFLQYQHKETLQKLHQEVDLLRRENKELKYKMIMDAPKLSRKVLKHTQVGVGPAVRGREPPQNQMLRSMGDCVESLGPFRPNRRSEQLGGLVNSQQPLQVHNGLSHPPRASTLRECELIIRQLYNTNSLQSQEIVRYKELLSDIVLNKRITPENYNLTKAFLVDDICKSSDNTFPKLDLQTGKMTGVTLPALTQSVSSSVAERQRRGRAVHRGHVKGTVR